MPWQAMAQLKLKLAWNVAHFVIDPQYIFVGLEMSLDYRKLPERLDKTCFSLNVVMFAEMISTTLVFARNFLSLCQIGTYSIK